MHGDYYKMIKLIPNYHKHDRNMCVQFAHTDSEELFNHNKFNHGPERLV